MAAAAGAACCPPTLGCISGTLQVMVFCAQGVNLGLGVAFESRNLIVFSAISMSSIVMAWIANSFGWRLFSLIFNATVTGIALFVVVTARIGSFDLVVDFGVDVPFVSDVLSGLEQWLTDFIKGIPEGVAWATLVGNGLSTATAFFTYFFTSGSAARTVTNNSRVFVLQVGAGAKSATKKTKRGGRRRGRFGEAGGGGLDVEMPPLLLNEKRTSPGPGEGGSRLVPRAAAGPSGEAG